MTLFSHRKGLKKVRTEIQVNSMDNALRNRLWNVLDYFYWSHERKPPGFISQASSPMQSFLNRLWHYHFKEPVDGLPYYWQHAFQIVKERYFKSYSWYEVYDFIEFVANNYENEETNKRFMKTCNDVLEKELSAYRFVGGKIAQITSEIEISEIEEALETPLTPVNTHLTKSLELLSDRKTPDYRNSIKESISAVESIFRLITKKDNVPLGQALKEVETKIPLHGALKKAFSNLYGYTSSAEGIRHALLDESKLSFEDAKFMLVSCSAFINYLTSKVEKAGIEL